MKLNFLKSSFRGRDILNLLIEADYLAAVFLIPLYFSYLFPTYNVFDLNKIILFKILVWLLLLFTGLKFIFYCDFKSFNHKDKKNISLIFKKYFLLPSIFIVGLFILLLFSSDALQSFFGSYDRQMGVLSYLFYFVWFLLLFVNISGSDKELNRKKINRIIITAVGAGFIASVYGILQILNIDFITWSESPFIDRRVTSTLGQPNFLASYLLLIIPLSSYLLLKSQKFLEKFFYCLIIIFNFLCLFFTASRGAFIALILTVFLLLLFLGFRAKIKIIKKIVIVFGFIVLVATGALGLEYFLPGRISNLVNLQYGSSAVRVIFYKVAMSAISQKPLLGYGLESGSEIYIKYYKPDWGIYGDVGAITDRAHNLFLDILLSGGIIGLLFFSLLYYHFFYLVKKNIQREGVNSLSLFLGLGAVAYLMSLMFSFTIITGEIYFWMFLAILSSISFMSGRLREVGVIKYLNNSLFLDKIKNSKSFLLSYGAAVFILFIMVFSGINFEKRNLMADYYYTKLYYALAAKEYFNALVFNDFLMAEKPNKENQIYYDQFLATKLSDFYPSISDSKSNHLVRRELIRINYDLGQRGYKNIFAHAKINGVLGRTADSQKYFSVLEEITPFWPFLYSSKGQIFFANKKYQDAIDSYQSAISSLPDREDPRLKINNDRHNENVLKYYYVFNREIGNSYFALKKYPEAEKFFQLAYKNDLSDYTLLKKIADTYYLRGDLDKTIKYNEQGYNRNPSDYNWSLALAYLYHEKNNKQKSLEYLAIASKIAPDNLDLKKMELEYSR